MEKIWLKSYPKGMPAEVDLQAYASIVDVFEESVKKFHDKPSYTNFGTTLTYADMDMATRDLAAYLQQRLGLKKGDRVAIMMPNLLQDAISIFAVLRAGLIVVNTNPLYTARELQHQLKDSGATTIIIVENFAHVLWEKLATQQDIGTLHTLRLCEDEDLYAEVTAADGREMATVTKRFTFNATQGDHQGRDWDCFVTVRGKIDPTTGMVTDIGALDRLVEDEVIKKFNKQNLLLVFNRQAVSGEDLARNIFQELAPRITQGTLTNIRLVPSRDLAYEVSASSLL